MNDERHFSMKRRRQPPRACKAGKASGKASSSASGKALGSAKGDVPRFHQVDASSLVTRRQCIEEFIPCTDLAKCVISFDLSFVCHHLPVTLDSVQTCTPEMIFCLYETRLRSWFIPWLVMYIQNKAVNFLHQHHSVLGRPTPFHMNLALLSQCTSVAGKIWCEIYGPHLLFGHPLQGKPLSDALYKYFQLIVYHRQRLVITFEMEDQATSRYLFEQHAEFKETNASFAMEAQMTYDLIADSYQLQIILEWRPVT